MSRQLDKLINVLEVTDLTRIPAVERELMLVKVSAPESQRAAILDLVQVFRARVVDLGSDLRPEDFLNPGIALDAQLSADLLLNLFAVDTPLHDGAVLVKGNRILSAGVILPLSRQGLNRYGTRHLAALGITERFDRCLCIVVSEETGTLSMARQGRLERPLTSSRLQELLGESLAQSSKQAAKGAGRSVAMDKAESSP
jgi:hypothetical protein